MSSRPSRGAARLAAILDALPDALLLVNRNGTVVNANAMALEALEAPGTPIVGRGLLDLLPTFDRSRIPGSVRAMDATDTRTKPTRMTARRTDGSLLPVEVTSANLPGAYDDELLMIVVRDLSGSVDVESELQRQQRQTEMILRAASEGIIGIDSDGSIVLANPAAARILRHRASDLGGKSLHELLMAKKADGSPLPPEDCPPLNTLKTGRKQRLRDQVLWRGDGETVPVEMTTAPILLGEAVVGAVMTFTDLSREHTLVDHREQLAELLDGELLARFEASRARLKTLADGSIGELGPSARRVVRQVAGELEEMSGLATEILEHQRGEKKDEAERSAATVDDLLDRALETVTYPARAAGIEFTVTAAPVGVQVDVDAMTRALGHLIADTVGAGPKGATVVVAAAQRGAVARIEVRGPASRGSSVHVPLARAVIEAHGGTVESHTVEGRGSTYVVELPADDEAAAKARPQDAAQAGQDRTRARKRARTSPPVRPGTAAGSTGPNASGKADKGTKSGKKDDNGDKDAKDDKSGGGGTASGSDASDKADKKGAGQADSPGGDADGKGGGGSDASGPGRRRSGTESGRPGGGSAPQLPAVRPSGELERATPVPPPSPGMPSLPAPNKPIALPAGDSAAPGAASGPAAGPNGPTGQTGQNGPTAANAGAPPSVPLVPASGGRRAAHRALPPSTPADDAGQAGGPASPQGGSGEDGTAAAAARPGVPAKVNGHHTRHMARARHHLSMPPAQIPSQSRTGAPGTGSRSTSVQDRPETDHEQQDLAPTELLEQPDLPDVPDQQPPGSAEAPTALMPHMPFPPSGTPAPPTAPGPQDAPGQNSQYGPQHPQDAQGGHSGQHPHPPYPEHPGNSQNVPPRSALPGRRRRGVLPPPGQHGQPGYTGQGADDSGRHDAQPGQDPHGQVPHGQGQFPYGAMPPGYAQTGAPSDPGSGTGTHRSPNQDPSRNPNHDPGHHPGHDPNVADDGSGHFGAAPRNDATLVFRRPDAADPLPQRRPGAAPHPGMSRELAPGTPAQAPGPDHTPAPPHTGQHQTGQHHTGQHQAGQDHTGQHDTGQHDTGHTGFPDHGNGNGNGHSVPGQGGHTPGFPGHATPGHGTPAHGTPAHGSHAHPALEMDTPPPGELAAVDPNYPPMVDPAPDGRPRRLLVWPSPDGPTSGALSARGWDPVLVRSREEVDASAPAHPAALFVDPLTGPITRTALQSLRTAATAAEIPVLVTAGLMQATRDAAFGADPAVLLRSLAPADSAAHASRVLLVEGNEDIAAAFTGSLVRRGMDVVHVTSESEAVSKASSVEPNLVVLDLMLVRRRRLGIVDWLRNNQRLHSTPIVVYTTVDIAEDDLPSLRTGETVLFLAERSTRKDVQQRVIDLLGKIASLV